MRQSRPKISIVIPAYNEALRLPPNLRRVYEFMESLGLPYEVLVIIEKSSDSTLALCREISKDFASFSVIDNLVQRGKGYAVRSGMLRATGEIVFFMDADLSTDLAEIPRFYEHFQKHPNLQLVIGSRAQKESQITEKQSFLRRNMGRTFNALVKLFAIKGIQDTQCGFKAFQHRCVPILFERQMTDAFAFDVEILLLAQRLNYQIGVLPVQWANSADSKVRIVRDSLRMLWDLLWLRYRVHRTLRQRPPAKEDSWPASRAS